MHNLQNETNPKEGTDSLQIPNTTTKSSLPLDQKSKKKISVDMTNANSRMLSVLNEQRASSQKQEN